MLVFGIVFAVLGTVFGLPAMRLRLHINLAQQGNFFFLLYLGIFSASLLIGPLIDHLGHKPNLFLSSSVVTAAMVLFAAADSYRFAALAAILLGLGGGGLNLCTNVLVSEVYGERRGPMLNVLGIFFGVGAISLPLLAAVIEGHLTIPQMFLICAVLAGACALAYAIISFPSSRPKQAFSLRDLYAITRYDGILLLASILFAESGNEASIAGWTSTYVNSGGYPPRAATLVLAGFWAALMFSRLLAARLLKGIGKARIIFGNALIALVGCLLLLSARSLVLLALGTALIGLSYGPIFPTTLAIAGDHYRQRAGAVFGLLFSVALIGGMLFPWAVGHFSEKFSVHVGMMVPAAGAIAITVSSAVMIFRSRGTVEISKANKTSF